jgi:hypothetical protein
MTDNSNIHWTDDDELLSKFVLRHLSPSEEERLTSHLRKCEKCQHAVKEETRVAAGTKLAGRLEMKDQLKARLEESEHVISSSTKRPSVFQIPWMRVASFAAVLVMLIAVGVYNNWFSANYWNTSAPPEQVAQQQTSPHTETLEKDERVSETKQGKDNTHSTVIPNEDRSDRARANETQRRREKRSTDKGYADNELAKSAGAAASPDIAAGNAHEEARQMNSEVRLTDESMTPPPQAFWVEGHVISSEAAPRDEMRNQLAEQPKKQVFARRQIESMEKLGDQNMLRLDRDSTSIVIALNQKPSSSLPPSQQNKQGQPRLVQTFIENRISNIQMTLYLDSLVPDSELRSADIETIGADSLVLNFSNQRIGYRLPPALSEKVNTKARQVK